MNITVTGQSGRRGQAVIAAIEAEPNASLHATHDKGQDLAPALSGADAVIDFTLPSLTDDLLAQALAAQVPLIIGTTGHSDEQRTAIAETAKTLPIVYAYNYSVGVNTLFWLTRHAARILGNEAFDIKSPKCIIAIKWTLHLVPPAPC